MLYVRFSQWALKFIMDSALTASLTICCHLWIRTNESTAKKKSNQEIGGDFFYYYLLVGTIAARNIGTTCWQYVLMQQAAVECIQYTQWMFCSSTIQFIKRNGFLLLFLPHFSSTMWYVCCTKLHKMNRLNPYTNDGCDNHFYGAIIFPMNKKCQWIKLHSA